MKPFQASPFRLTKREASILFPPTILGCAHDTIPAKSELENEGGERLPPESKPFGFCQFAGCGKDCSICPFSVWGPISSFLQLILSKPPNCLNYLKKFPVFLANKPEKR